jgi:mono/diheme cytochrome c family protein
MIKKWLRREGLLLVLLLACPLLAQTTGNNDVPVTPVEGESLIHHLHKPLSLTSMGKTWDYGPPPPMPGGEIPHWQLDLSLEFSTQVATLHGSDLYRVNCQGCHGETGLGAPPEINSIINPVRATSVGVIMARAKKTGQDVSLADATVLAAQAKTSLLQRLHNGGQEMPSFRHLNEAEIRSIVAYLEQLSEIPGAGRRQVALKESKYRVGEQIVKSTCHVCHSATGPNPAPEELLYGAIPPLNSLMARMNLSEFVRKVVNGAPIVMGNPPLPYRGRMPVFHFLSQDEAADVYLYLTLYPPTNRR